MENEPRANMLAVQSLLEEIAFKNKMECGYARNPFTNKQLKASTTEDVLQHVYHDKLPFSGAAGRHLFMKSRKMLPEKDVFIGIMVASIRHIAPVSPCCVHVRVTYMLCKLYLKIGNAFLSFSLHHR